MVKIGDKVFIINPDYRNWGTRVEFFVEREIISETSRSWVVGNKGYEYSYVKIPKNKTGMEGGILTNEQAEKIKWARNNKRKIVESAHRLNTYEELMKLAELTGWKEGE